MEQAFVRAADLKVVPIRPLVLATNALSWAHPIRTTGRFALYQPDALTAPIHERDVADVATTALTTADAGAVSGHAYRAVPKLQREQVATIARTLGRDLDVTELPRDEAAAQFARFMPATEAEAVLQFLDDAAAGNSPATVHDVLARPATDFGTWASDHANDFR